MHGRCRAYDIVTPIERERREAVARSAARERADTREFEAAQAREREMEERSDWRRWSGPEGGLIRVSHSISRSDTFSSAELV